MPSAARRVLLPPLLVLLATLGAACGGDEATDGGATSAAAATGAPVEVLGGSSEAAPATPAPPPRAPRSLHELVGLAPDAAFATPDVLFLGALDLAAGRELRVPFAVVDKGGGERRVDGGRADVWLARRAQDRPIGPFPARVEVVAAEGVPSAEGDIQEILVARPTVPEAGGWLMVATYTVDGRPSSANVGLSLLEREQSPAVGDPAPRSETPTLRSTGGDVAALSTAESPQRSLLEHSVAESLDDRVPFVLVFATPKFCTSRLCGPVVEIVAEVQRRLRGTPMRFIHVEVYEGNEIANGTNRWFREWRLENEPWVFVVGADGRVADKFEGVVSRRELEAAARATLA